MSEVFEVVVVGAGMFGSAAGKYLARAGADVLVVGPSEPFDRANANQYTFAAHFDEARISRRLGWDQVWGATDARSLERFRDIEEESGIRFFHECGSLVLMAGSIKSRTDAIMERSTADGIAVDRMSDEELRQEFPGMALPTLPGGIDGLMERQEAGYLNPRELVRAQHTLTETAGGKILRAVVMGVGKDKASGLWCLQVDNGRTRREIQAKKVLIATGAFTNHNAVLPDGQRLAIFPFTEPNLLFEVGDDQLEELRRLPAIVTVDPDDTGDANLSFYLLPPVRYPDGKWYMRIGPGMQPIVEELKTVDEMSSWLKGQLITPRQKALLMEMLRTVVPGLTPVSVQSACCIIEKTPSRYPYIGAIHEDTLTVAVGGNGHGARGSDEIGRLAATVTLGEPWDCSTPQKEFSPIPMAIDATSEQGRPDFLKPPFGLC